ncbi:hypothetical protein ABBQ38_011776 [Trebouxia sp. C0009 RCD-2024]
MGRSQGYVTKTHFLKQTHLGSLLEPANPSEADFTATKVVVTIGPSCQDVDNLCLLLQAGATCARCDLTWGTLDYHKRSLQNLNEAMRRTRKLCAVMLDTTGREIMVMREHQIDEKGWPEHVHDMQVTEGQKLTITQNPEAKASNEVLPVSYPKFTTMVQTGDTIFIGRYLVTGSEDSSLYVTVDDIQGDDVICTAANHANLDGLVTIFHTERSPDMLNNVQNDLPIMTSDDKSCIKGVAAEFEIDFISLSFTRSGEDVQAAREFLDSIHMQTTKLIAKCETRQSLFNFKAIAQEADAVMLSRGNLGLDVLPEKMALVQKHVIQQCNLLGKPVIVTRVVDTMVTSPRPTRAEATDVANAVLDGVDCIMLGAETLRGKHPVATVETILHICKQAEKVFDHNYHFETLMREAMDADEHPDMLDFSDAADGLARTTSNVSFNSEMHHSRQPGHGSNGGMFPSQYFGSTPKLGQRSSSPVMSKLESIASSAVRAADKVQAALIIVYTHTGHTASLVSKYRPAMPILTLVIPQLKTEAMKWRLEGRAVARQCQIGRSLFPVLAAPSPSGETLLEEVVVMAAKVGLVKAQDHIVCVQRVGESFVIKIVSVNDSADGVEIIRPKSLINLIRATAGDGEDVDMDEALGNKKNASSGKQPTQQIAGNLCPPSESKGANGDSDMAVHPSAVNKGAVSNAPHLSNLPSKQTTAVTDAIEPRGDTKKSNGE